uniref:Platelet-activating factor receptor n=1 Tax=Mola mola TaxID=94237 RepID=A0A3Q3W953_MOLML
MEPHLASNGSTFLDSEFRYTLFPIAYGIIFILGLLANIYVLFILRWLRETKAMGEIRIYMTNLTIADLLFVCALPFWIGYYSRHGNWVYEDFMCRLTGSLFFINTYCSILFLGAISMNRYWAVTKPLDAASSDHRRRGIIVCVVIWLLTVSMAVPYLVIPGTNTDENMVTRCFEGYQNQTDSPLHAHSRLKRRALQMLFAVVGVFVVCFLPHHVIQGPWTLVVLQIEEGWGHVGWDQNTRQAFNDAHQITLLLMGLNCILDPIVYCFATRKFRKYIMAHIKNQITSKELQEKDECVSQQNDS